MTKSIRACRWCADSLYYDTKMDCGYATEVYFHVRRDGHNVYCADEKHAAEPDYASTTMCVPAEAPTIYILNVLVSDHPQRDKDVGYFTTMEAAEAAKATLSCQACMIRPVQLDLPVAAEWRRK